MLPDIRKRNGLGDPPVRFTTNDNEAMNSKFKKWQTTKANDLPQFIDNVKEFVEQDHSVVQDAFSGRGEYKLVGRFARFFV